MAKMIAALMTVFLIEVSLVFFGGVTYGNSILYSFLMGPTAITSALFYTTMIAILLASAAATIVPGSFYQVNQWALFAAASVIFITFAVNISHLWAFINGQLIGIFSSSIMGGFIASLITAPLFVFYMVSVVEWTRQN